MSNIQELTFETHSLDDFAKMLGVVIEITKATHVGRYRPEELAKLDAEHQRYCRLDEGYPSYAYASMMSDAASVVASTLDWQPPQQRWRPFARVCSLHQGKGMPLETSEAFATTAEGVARVVELVKAMDEKWFDEETNGGPFRSCEGSTYPGYRLHTACLRETVHVQLCHVYMPK